MKTILTFVGGGDRDVVILQTALAVAIPLSAHLDCLHAHVPAVLAARYAHIEFAGGTALRNTLEQLGTNSEAFTALAAEARPGVLRESRDRDVRCADRRPRPDGEFSRGIEQRVPDPRGPGLWKWSRGYVDRHGREFFDPP